MAKNTNGSGKTNKVSNRMNLNELVEDVAVEIEETEEVSSPITTKKAPLQFAHQKPEKGEKVIRKTECPISRQTFADEALPVILRIEHGEEGQTLESYPRENNSGSFGWLLNGKVTLLIGGERVKCQLTGNLTVIGSKGVE